MADGMKILGGYVEIVAQHGSVDAYLDKLPNLVRNSTEKAAAKARILRDEIDRQEAALRRLISSFGMASAAQIRSDNEVVGYTNRIKMLNAQLAQSGEVTRKGFSRGNSQGFINFGRMLDDMQYVGQNGMGLRPIINNLMELNPAIGIAALTFDSLFRVLGKSNTKTEAEHMAELAKKTNLTVAETQSLLKYERERTAHKAIQEYQPEAQKKQTESAIKAIGESDQDQLAKDLVSTHFKGIEITPDLQQKMIAAYSGFGTPEQKAKAQKDLREAEVRAAKDALAKAATDPKKLDQLVGHMMTNAPSFDKDAISRLKAAKKVPFDLEMKAQEEFDDVHAKVLTDRAVMEGGPALRRRGKLNEVERQFKEELEKNRKTPEQIYAEDVAKAGPLRVATPEEQAAARAENERIRRNPLNIPASRMAAVALQNPAGSENGPAGLPGERAGPPLAKVFAETSVALSKIAEGPASKDGGWDAIKDVAKGIQESNNLLKDVKENTSKQGEARF